LLLVLPLVGVGVWLVTLGAGYGPARFLEGCIATLALTGFATLLARWRLFAFGSWLVAWLLYLAGLIVVLAEALAWYFQGSSFNVRFFANVRLQNLLIGVRAFPVLSVLVAAMALGMLGVSAWLLQGCARKSAPWQPRPLIRVSAVLVLLAIAVTTPSSWQRLGMFAFQYRHDRMLAASMGTGLRLLADPDPVPRNVVRAKSGRNLVIIYMESLERIYTDNRIFPGLTPRLNHWRASGLDFSGYLTFTGADYTIAGLFSSQCGVPYLPSPLKVLDFSGNDSNRTSFQPDLACLGDVLHAAGYKQVFMNGVDLSFANDGTFFQMHGFDQVLGLKSLENRSSVRLPHPGWGLYDRDLFRLALEKFDELASAGKPFNLDVLTIDNHPPHGRPSPGCPKYAANGNDTLQAVHCTDDLVGRFLDAISKNPAWKDTIVAVMSDHESLRNDAWSLYPKSYKRRPLLFVLNAGQGRRDMRFFHMDIAPTLLHLMGVQTNATFLAGADRSEAEAPGNPLVNDAADVAVLRKTLWTRAQPLVLCKKGVLVGAADDGVRMGGVAVPMSWNGAPTSGLRRDGAWLVWTNSYSMHGEMLVEHTELAKRLADRAPGESGLLVQSLAGVDPMKQFSIDWIGIEGGRTHLATVPRLRNLEIASPQCSSLLARMQSLPAGRTLDLSDRFETTFAHLYPGLPRDGLEFNAEAVRPFEREVGWTEPEQWGSFTVGNLASMGFTLPHDHCHAMPFTFKLRPFLSKSRPKLEVKVVANGALMATWHFEEDARPRWREVPVSIRTPDPRCRVDLRFEFDRPGAAPPPYAAGEDPRPLQLLFLEMRAGIRGGRGTAGAADGS